MEDPVTKVRRPLLEERVLALESIVRSDPQMRVQYDRMLQLIMNKTDGKTTIELVANAKAST
jgi:hypothetical protein